MRPLAAEQETTPTTIVEALLRRRTVFLSTALACFAATVALTLALPPRYDATATLFVGERKTGDATLAFDTNVGEQLARTYTTLAGQPGMADVVRGRLQPPPTRQELLERMTFTPVERTQLLQITARGQSAEEAARLANTYSETFIDRIASDFSRGNAPTRVTLATPAAEPTKPAAPNVPLYLGFGLGLSLLLAAGAALLRDRLDDRLRVGRDDLAVVGYPILARIPTFDAQSTEDPVAADGFRLLAANIDFSRDSPPRTIGVTSPAPLDGKSTVAAQLAMALVASGERVLLVEGDLRRPGIRNTAVADRWNPATRGLTHYLWGAAQVDEVICAHPRIPGLSVIWAGAQVPNPSGMLASRRLGHLLAVVAERFDRVIIDTSPISVGADASIVLARLDGSLFVINARRTSRSGAHTGIAQLETARAAVLGIVVNRDERATDRHYGYYTASEAGEELAASPRGWSEAPEPARGDLLR